MPIDVLETLRLLRSKRAEERWQAALALGDSGDVRALKPLQHALNDRNVNVRANASWSLARLGGAALPILLQALQAKNVQIRGLIPSALAELGDWCALDPLLATMSDPSPAMRAATVIALVHFPCAATITALYHTLDDPDPTVRYFAVQSLQRIEPRDRVYQAVKAHIRDQQERQLYDMEDEAP
jgi:HEAT repeat protein